MRRLRGWLLRLGGLFGRDQRERAATAMKYCRFKLGTKVHHGLIETVDGPPCDQPGTGSGAVLVQLACAAGIIPCPPGTSYPQPTQVEMMPLAPQQTMPDPCADVPVNPWCPATVKAVTHPTSSPTLAATVKILITASKIL